MRLLKTFLALLLLIGLGSTTSAQTISPSDLDATWAPLDLSETTTGILANRRAIFLDPTAFQGSTAADTLDPTEWEVLYGQFRTSAATPSSLPDPATLAVTTRAELAAGRFDATGLPGGVYLVRMEAGGAAGAFVRTERVTLAR